MKRLNELRSLVTLARQFGQEPDRVILDELTMLEKDEAARLVREAAIKSRIAADLTAMFEGVKIEPGQSIPVSDVPGLGAIIAEAVDAGVIEVAGASAEPAASGLSASVQQPSNVDRVAKVIAEQGVVAPDPVLARPQKDLSLEVKYLREWISRIAATGPGGGAGSQSTLDSETTFVTGDYTIKSKDYYIGVSSNTSVTIVLPVATKPGRQLVVKDESGRCSINTITLAGTVDNDTSGVVMAIDNQGLQLIYRTGWRII